MREHQLSAAFVPSVIVLGAAIDWACRHHPASLPVWAPWDFSWSEYLAATLVLGAYVRGLVRAGPRDRPTRAQIVSVFVGVLAIYAVLQTRFDYLAQHMFALTRVQHLVTHHLGPFLIALGWPFGTIRRGMPAWLRRSWDWRVVQGAVDWLQQPAIAGFLFVGLIFLWLIPPVLFRAMLDARLYLAMNWLMVLDGVLFWALVLDPRPCPPARLPRAARLLLVFGVQFPQIVGGALIGFADTTLYPYYDLCGRLYPAVDAQADQQIGGFVILFGGGMMSALAAILLLRGLWAEEQVLTVPE